MKNFIYEKHVHEDPDFPFFFHLDPANQRQFNVSRYHWHESIEILNCIEGSCQVILNGKILPFQKGETLIVDPFSLHTTVKDPLYNGVSWYHCLIVDKSFFASLRLPTDPHATVPVIRDEELNRLFDLIYKEFQEQEEYWQQSAKAMITTLVVRLSRILIPGQEKKQRAYHAKFGIAADAMKYLFEHFSESISIEDLSRALGFNKYYLCHVFREITGETIIGYLNVLRCNHARNLLSSGHRTVSEAAEESGFCSFSYFSKTYRRLFGHSPSEDRLSKQE